AALDAPHRAARDHEVVAGLEAEVTVVAEELAAAGVHEQQFVAVGVAGERARRRIVRIAAPEAQPRGGVVEQLRRAPGRVLATLEFRAVEGAGPQRTLEIHPTGGRMLVIQVRGRAEEAFL